MSADVGALEAAYRSAKDRRDAAYWRFTRCAKASPDEMTRLSLETSQARTAWLDAKRATR